LEGEIVSSKTPRVYTVQKLSKMKCGCPILWTLQTKKILQADYMTNLLFFKNFQVDSGYVFVLPERDASGRRVIFNYAKVLDPTRHTRFVNTYRQDHFICILFVLELLPFSLEGKKNSSRLAFIEF
jgi:hypothetical protein